MNRIPEQDIEEDLKASFLRLHGNLDELRDNSIKNTLLQLFGDVDYQYILDLGCGPGTFTAALANCFDTIVCGIDGSITNINLANVVKMILDDKRLFFTHTKMPCNAEHPFDLIVSRSVLHHLENPMDLWTTIQNIQPNNRKDVFVFDLVRPDTKDAVNSILMRRFDSLSGFYPDKLKASLMSAYTIEEVMSQIDKANIDLNVEKTDDHHMMIYGSLK